jgi:hypothetical protein
MAVLVNHVILENGIPSRLHFTDHRIERRTITEPSTGRPAIREVLALTVDTLDGRPVSAELSTMAEKLAGQFEPYLVDKSYRDYDFTITQLGEGFMRSWSVKVTPRR